MSELIAKHEVSTLKNALNTILTLIASGESGENDISNIRDGVTVELEGLPIEKQFVGIYIMSEYDLVDFDDLYLKTQYIDVAKYIARDFSSKMNIQSTLETLQ